MLENFAEHGEQINDDFDKIGDDWSQDRFFDMGATVADVIVEFIGPIGDVPLGHVGPLLLPKFAAGLFWGFSEENDLPEFEECARDFKLTFEEAQKLVKNLAEHKFIDAFIAGKHLLKDAHLTGPTCKATEDDKERVNEWAEIFDDFP